MPAHLLAELGIGGEGRGFMPWVGDLCPHPQVEEAHRLGDKACVSAKVRCHRPAPVGRVVSNSFGPVAAAKPSDEPLVPLLN